MRVIGMNTTLETDFFFLPCSWHKWRVVSDPMSHLFLNRLSSGYSGSHATRITPNCRLLGRFFIVQISVHFGHVVGEFRNGQLWERKCDGDYSLVQTTEKVKLDNKLVTILFIFNLIIASSFTNHLGMQKKAYIWTRTKRGLVKGTLALCLIADWFFLVLFW